MTSRLGAAPSDWLPTPSVWVDSSPYALVTNPNALGGEQVNLTAIMTVPINEGWYVEESYAQPIYLDLSDRASSERHHFSLEIGTSF